MKNQKEVWKPVKNYEGLYEVSNLGNINSLSRFRKGNKGVNTRVKGRSMGFYDNKKGYLTVCLSLNSKHKTRTVHQLVAESFLNHNRCGHKIIVDHIDGDKHNNHLSNLQLITQRENTSKNGKGKCKYIGVSLSCSGKFKSAIHVNGKIRYLGRYKNPMIASAVYQYELEQINNKHGKL